MIALNDQGESELDIGGLPYRIGDIPVSVDSELDEVLADFNTLYHGCRRGYDGAASPIRMQIRRVKRSLLRSSRYLVFGDGEEIGKERRRQEVLPFLEWGINWRVMATRDEFLQLHAATMVHQDRGFIFAGPSGCGKSTLVAGLLSRGWRYLSDEFALIHQDSHHLHAFPKAVCVKAGSFETIERLNLPFAGDRYYIKGLKGRVAYVNPRDVGPDAVATPVPVRFVVFPKYVRDGNPRLHPMTRARAAFALTGCALNRQVYGERAVSILSDVVRGAECYALESGPIEQTCELIESLLSS